MAALVYVLAICAANYLVFLFGPWWSKLHGLRMLDVRVLGMYPFASADSTNVAVNVPKTEKRFPEITDKLARTAVLRAAIEKVHPPSISAWVDRKMREPAQAGFLFEFTDAA